MKSVTLNLPEALYERIKERAEQSQHSVEVEILGVVTSAVPITGELSPDLANAISPLASMDDKGLYRAAQHSLSKKAFAKLQTLHLKRQREGLNEKEIQTLADLMKQYERAVLIRAHAIELLRQRGYDISALIDDK